MDTNINVSNNQSTTDSGFLDESIIENRLLLSNEEEKIELNKLNNRLANYVEYVKQRDLNNTALQSINEVSSIPSLQLANLRQLFEAEIKSLRETVDLQSNDAAKLRIARDKLEAEKSDMENKLIDKNEIINRQNDIISKWKAENEKLKSEIAMIYNTKDELSKLSKQLKECQNQLEMEVLLRTSADNACLTYKEKMEFNEAVFKKELGALFITHKNTVQKLSRFSNNISSSNIFEEMEEARKNLGDYLNDLRSSIDNDILTRIEKATNLITKSFEEHSKNINDKGTLSIVNSELLEELAKIKASHVKLENQISDLESLHEDEISRFYQSISLNTSKLEEQIDSALGVGQSLHGAALLDSEIKIYRKMIEAEERRTGRRAHSPALQEEEEEENSPEVKRRKKSQETEDSNTNIITSVNNRPIIRASRRTRNCNIM